jgi:HAD superfamily hydrolase (TIGR01484 family)
MRPLSLSQLSANQIKGVFSDLDDTLTDDSLLLPSTLQALHELKKRGFWIVIVSGRPAGWADSIMRLVPLDAMIFENGAGLMWREQSRIKTLCLAPNQNLQEQKKILQDCFDRIQKHIPELKLATDQPYRLFDFAIDFNEEPPKLSTEQVNWILDFLKKDKRVTAKLSSIHINYWVGNHTKLTACQYLIDNFGKLFNATKDNLVYSGDSPNDEPLFGFFPNSVGVANVTQYLPVMKDHPKYITEKAGGLGFQELVFHLCKGTHN